MYYERVSLKSKIQKNARHRCILRYQNPKLYPNAAVKKTISETPSIFIFPLSCENIKVYERLCYL